MQCPRVNDIKIHTYAVLVLAHALQSLNLFSGYLTRMESAPCVAEQHIHKADREEKREREREKWLRVRCSQRM